MVDQTPKPMPPALQFLLTRPLPCAALMAAMLMGVQLPLLTPGMPTILALLLTLFGLVANLLSPGLIALITYGGGPAFAIRVAAIAAGAIALVNGFAIVPGMITFLLYGLLPTMAAMAMMQKDGIRKSAEYVAGAATIAMMAPLLLLVITQDISLQAWMEAKISPMFAGMSELPTDKQQAMALFHKTMAGVLPGLMAISIWMLWWGNLEAARHQARKYGFYRGNTDSLLTLSFDKVVAYAFGVLLVLVNTSCGDAQYVAANLFIVCGGLLAAQGVAVAHSWLKARGLGLTIGLMYVMLLIWSAMIIPMLIIGLLDLWYNFRRNSPAVGG